MFQFIGKCFFLVLLCLFSNCKKENYYTSVPDSNEPANIDIVIHGFTGQGYKKQSLEWDVQADVSYVSYATSKIEMKNLHLLSYGSPPETTQITSDAATMNRDTSDMIIRDNVEVKSSNGRQLYTNLLNWDNAKKELFTDAPVKIIYPDGEIIHGMGMKSNGGLDKLIIYQPVGVHTSNND
ncbi:MAG: LPS export ABC transporter periplasmic protein LptC [Spirochaetia bacterium]|nr:LPS export ABC transporter periplasmic protein LptC [Spirochaetia bacterium]